MLIFPLSGCKSDKLVDDFVSPPDTMTTGVYWYWMSDNISKEGVIKDLQAMKKAGINSAFIGNIGDDTPYGKVKLFSDEWWEVLHATMKTAGELGIEIGMFNSPGWSHSGGPWITPEQSMRHLVSSETEVKGGAKVSVKLPVPSQPPHFIEWSNALQNASDEPAEHFQDVRVLAVPAPEDYRFNLFDAAGAKVSLTNMLSPKDAPRASRARGVPPTSPLVLQYLAPREEEASITLQLPQPRDARSLTIYPSGICRGEGKLQAKINGEYVTVATYPLRRTLFSSFVGFTPFAPVVVGFDKVTSSEYRIVFRSTDSDAAIGKIVLSPTAALDQYPEKTLARMYQGDNPPFTEYKWTSVNSTPAGNDEATAIVSSKIIDLTDKMQPDGTLVWDAPEGEWIVLRMGMVTNDVFVSPASLEGSGLEVDKLNPEYLPHHFDKFLGEVLRRIPAEDRRTFRVTVMDSWEKGGQTFTDNFIDSLKAKYGYDPTPFLPVMTGHLVGSPEQSERFLWDVRRLAAEIAGNNLLSNFNAISHKHGIETWIENYGDWGFPGEFLLFGKHTDRVGGEFWAGGKYCLDAATSCAHIYNKPHVYAESFTSGSGYPAHPYSIKRDGDAAFAAGLTRCVLHVYIEQPYEDKYPGVESWFGVEFNRKNTWFGQLDLFTTYLKRCGVMLEQGLPVSDIAYFIGEDVPVNSGPFGLKQSDAKDDVNIHELPQGYHADYVNSDVILNTMSVKDGKIVLPHGVSYSILVLPPLKTMRPEVLKGIERLVAEGAVVLGEAPVRSPSLQNYPAADKELNDLATKMWGDKTVKQRSYGKGQILSGMTIEEALKTVNVAPDVKLDNENLVYAHRTTPDREIYFIANRSEKTIQVSPEFRVTGRQPELWNPVNGETRVLPAFELKDKSTTVPLQLEPYESAFIVFSGEGKPQSSDISANILKPETVTEITSPWTVSFESDKAKRGPSEPVVFDKLQSWSENSDERIRYFSGTAVYNTTFTITDKLAGKIYIDLGRVCNMAKVKINGQYIGGAWTYPYRVDVAGAVKPGENTIEIEVVNTWVNRLIGDSFLPKEQRIVEHRYPAWYP
ncbi:MAG: glycoside hydrolase family 2, partial [Prevotellaceae bacterium]|nr:glycoside hydrolase family 2 [Prevotellaceae bacterium]